MRSIRMLRWGPLALALMVSSAAWLVTPSARAQVDLQKTLVGRWEGEVATRQAKNVTTVVLTIKSLKEEGGKWTAEALLGRSPVNLEIITSGPQPSLRWTGAQGWQYDVSVMDEKTMVGNVTLTTASGGSRGDRDRPVKLEKVEKK
jgi:hypothetical protein